MVTNLGFVEILNSVSSSLFAINGAVAYNMFQRCKREIMATRPSCRNRIVEFCWQLVVIEMWFPAFEAWMFFESFTSAGETSDLAVYAPVIKTNGKAKLPPPTSSKKNCQAPRTKINLHQRSVASARTSRSVIHMRHVHVAIENAKPVLQHEFKVLPVSHAARTHESYYAKKSINRSFLRILCTFLVTTCRVMNCDS